MDLDELEGFDQDELDPEGLLQFQLDVDRVLSAGLLRLTGLERLTGAGVDLTRWTATPPLSKVETLVRLTLVSRTSGAVFTLSMGPGVDKTVRV